MQRTVVDVFGISKAISSAKTFVESRSTKVQVHSETNDPDSCYNELLSTGKYKTLQKHLNNIIHKNVEKPTNDQSSTRFVCISDTHGKTENLNGDFLPEGDVLLHAGDFTVRCTREEIIHFNRFLGHIRHKYRQIIVIAGTHDVLYDATWEGEKVLGRRIEKRWKVNQVKRLLTNCSYIEDEMVKVDGIKIYGSPWTPQSNKLAFNRKRGEDMLSVWSRIPKDTDILLTHTPPLGIGDLRYDGSRSGCAELFSTVVERVRPRFHVFGRVHESYGVWNDGITTFINACTVTGFTFPVHKPVVFDI